MSLRSVTATGIDTVTPGLNPCLGVGGTVTDSMRYEQSGVRLNETLQITFLGTPPFNLTSTVCDNKGGVDGTCWCGTQSQTLDTNTFTWTVEGVNVTMPNSSNGSQMDVFTTLGHSMIWTAVEMNNISLTQRQYSFSPNFSLSTESFDDRPSGAASHSPSMNLLRLVILGLGLLSLMTFGGLAGI